MNSQPAPVLPDTKTLIASLMSDVCPICGRTKKWRQTMCPADYRNLPVRMRRALYDGVGDGYEEAVAAAMRHLGAAEFITRPVQKVVPTPSSAGGGH